VRSGGPHAREIFRTIRTIIFLIAAKLDFSRIVLYVAA
jgi:hypothetical protein